MVLLVTAGVAAYGIALLMVPIGRDELILFSSVAHAPHPFGYFVGDWGLGNHGYRPLFSATLWLAFQLFGVWALPYQLLSLGLHIVVIALLFELISHVARHDGPALRLLLALVALVSPYTVSGASWIADRPTLMVALSLLLLIRHLYVGGARPRPWILGGLSAIAVLSKESGLVVPALVVVYGWVARRPPVTSLGIAVIASYAGLRVALFGAAAASYPESGALLGIWEYQNSSMLTTRQFVITLVEHPVKHLLATILPVFDNDGLLLTTGDRLRAQATFWMPTIALAAVAGWRPSRAQKLALVVIILNAVVHFAVFRFRTLYLSHLAFVVYVAASPALATPSRRRIATALAVALLLANALSVERQLVENVWGSYDNLGAPSGRDYVTGEPLIDPGIVRAVERMYTK